MAAHDGQHQFSAPQDGPPYPPQFQSLGEVPSVLPDIPVNVIFLCLFLGAGVGHFLVLRRNQANGKKFYISIMILIFCLTRVIATSLRIPWACHPTDIHVGITVTVFVYAGIVLLYLANLFFAQRIVRAQHPLFGWSKPFTILYPVTFAITIGTILCLVAAVIVSFYTLDKYSRDAAREIQKYGSTMLAIVAFLPFAIVGISSVARRHPTIRNTKTTDKFGDGSIRAKVAICMVSSALLCLGASFRAGTVLQQPVPISAPAPGYLSKACFYIFNFTIEISVCLLWLGLRVDSRFYVPDGANGPFSYGNGFVFAGEFNIDRKHSGNVPNSDQALARPSSFRLSQSRDRSSQHRTSISSRRLSLPGSTHSKAIQTEKIAHRVSWGGVSREDVQVGMAEDKSEIPYPAFEHSGRYGDDPADIGIEGVEKELGWDPKSGKWAVRPISTANATAVAAVARAPTSGDFEDKVVTGWVDLDDEMS